MSSTKGTIRRETLMSLHVVSRQAGPGWTEGEGAFGQAGVQDHAAFMAELERSGFVLFAGPLAGSEQGRIRALVVVDAADEAEVRSRLGEDPWALTDRLVTTSVEPWTLFVGAERLVG